MDSTRVFHLKEQANQSITNRVARHLTRCLRYFYAKEYREALSEVDKAIEINPSYEAAYLNLVALILEEEPKIVDKMNSLGTSRADNAKYDVLKKKREDLYRECVPILKTLIELNKDEEAIRTLMNIYGTLGDNEGFMEMKKIID